MNNLRRIYADIHPSYEKANRILSLGMDRSWRRNMVSTAMTVAGTGNWLDMCTGTGETAILLRNTASRKTRIYAVDFSIDMIRQFRQKSASGQIPSFLGDASALPFKSQSFQLVTTSFATRNLNRNQSALIRTFSEFFRILTLDGIFVSIESSRPASRLVDAAFRSIVRIMVEPAGYLMSGNRTGYRYLSRSMRSFYHPEILSDLLLEAGFQSVRFKRLFFGAAAIHIASVSSNHSPE